MRLNLLSPDNFDKKLNELRELLFPDFKTRNECFENEENYDEETHQLTDEKLNEDTLQIAVKNIFRKAQDEKLFCVLNG